jgi:hypothetical protein
MISRRSSAAVEPGSRHVSGGGDSGEGDRVSLTVELLVGLAGSLADVVATGGSGLGGGSGCRPGSWLVVLAEPFEGRDDAFHAGRY